MPVEASLRLCRHRGAIDGCIHDDVIKWKHFPRHWPFVWGIHRSPVKSPHKGQWRGALMFSLICAWINAWVNNREAGDLRRYRAHYDVTVIWNIDVTKFCNYCWWAWKCFSFILSWKLHTFVSYNNTSKLQYTQKVRTVTNWCTMWKIITNSCF